jgi:hypothetical protein
MSKLLKSAVAPPRIMITDKLRSYGAARAKLGLRVDHRGLRHFWCSIFVGRLLRHYLEDDEDNEIGLRARDYRARRGVPWEPLGGIGGG